MNSDKKEFIEYWSNLYASYDDNEYYKNMKKPLTKEKIDKLFMWKNGRNISNLKMISIKLNYHPLIEKYKSNNAVSQKDLINAKNGGAIWNIFMFHILDSEQFPIFDQHVYRAMNYIIEGNIKELALKREDIIKTYLEEYLPFFNTFMGIEKRKIDKALWEYGKFLKENSKIFLQT
jgi:hypothetical protein